MSYLGFFVGALIITWIVSRLTRFFFFRKAANWTRAISPNVIALMVATGLGGVGMADGGPPQFLVALVRYIPPILVLIAFDSLKARKTATPPPSGP